MSERVRQGVRNRPRLALLVGAAMTCLAAGHAQAGGLRKFEPSQVLPLDQIDSAHREGVAEVIRDAHFHRQGKPETFPCNPKIYLALLNDPELTLLLWKDLSPNPAQLRKVGPGHYEGTDGCGTQATWRFVLRAPRLHVLYCNLLYTTPRGNAQLQARIVLVVRTGYFKEINGESWVQHDVEAFVKVDSRGWRTLAATLKPVIEKLLEDQVREAGWFVSLMARTVEVYPAWAIGVALKQTQLDPDTRIAFRELVLQHRRPGALSGRPALAEQPQPDQVRR